MKEIIKSHPESPSKPGSFLASHPVFTTAELDAALAPRWGGNPAARQSLLRYHEARGRLLRIRRGLYAVVPAGTDPSAAPVDPYLVASRLAEDAVLAYHTALAFHGCAHSVREERIVVSRASVRPFRYRGIVYRSVRPSATLVRSREEESGVVLAERGGIDVRVTSIERTMVDLLDRSTLGGGWEEVWRSLEAVPYVDIDAILRYSLLLGNATTTAAVGFFLESHRASLMVEPEHLEPFRRRIPRQPHYLDRAQPSRMVAGWNLLVPRVLLDPPWAEGT